MIKEHFGVRYCDFSAMTPEQWDQTLEQATRDFRTTFQNILLETDSAPTFDNTLGAIERMDMALSEVVYPFFASMAHSTPEMSALDEKWSPILSELGAMMMQQKDLYVRIQNAYANEGHTWTPEQHKLYHDTQHSFFQTGISLDDDEQQKIKHWMSVLAQRSAEFNRVNSKNASRTMSVAYHQLDGAPADLLAQLERVDEHGFAHCLIPVSTPYIEPLLQSVHNRQVREMLFLAWTRRGMGAYPGDTDTSDIIQETLRARHDLARALGYKNWAEKTLSNKMAQTPQRVMDTLKTTWNNVLPHAQHDLKQLTEFAQSKGFKGELKPWDTFYYLEQYRNETWRFDAQALKPYFPLPYVREQLFAICEKLFGVRFEPDEFSSYHPDTKSYKVLQHGAPIGLYVADDFVREGKAPGAWMTSFATPSTFQGQRLAGVMNVLNFPPPTQDAPYTLLDYDQIITLFHEMGHALHGLLGRTTYPSQSGTSVERDFVELPSQLLENWASSPEGLQSLSCHVDTGEPLAIEEAEKLVQSKQFGHSFWSLNYLQAAMLDMDVHQTNPEDIQDVAAWQKNYISSLNAPAPLAWPRGGLHHFSHIFAGGYSAGYYSYLWAEILEADIFQRFKDDRFDRIAAHQLQELLQAGGSQPGMELFAAMQGREPDPSCVLLKWGMTPERLAEPETVQASEPTKSRLFKRKHQ